MALLSTTCKQQDARVYYMLFQTQSIISQSRNGKGLAFRATAGQRQAKRYSVLHCQLYKTSRVQELAYC